MKGWPVLLCVILTVSGCMGSTPTTTSQASTSPHPTPFMEAWKPLACNPNATAQTSHDAEMVPGLVGDAEAIAKRIAAAASDPVTGPPTRIEDNHDDAWPTAHGYISVRMGSATSYTAADATNGTFVGANYHRNDSPLDADQVIAMAKALGAEASSLHSSSGATGSIWQEWSGLKLSWQPVGMAGASWRTSGQTEELFFGQFFVFWSGEATVPAAQAIATARDFIRCTLDAEGKTDAKGFLVNSTTILGAAVVNHTIAHLVNLHYTTTQFSPCGKWDARWVFVDVVTGVVRHTSLGPCL